MQGTLYTSGIGNISGMDCVHIPLWITYMDGVTIHIATGYPQHISHVTSAG